MTSGRTFEREFVVRFTDGTERTGSTVKQAVGLGTEKLLAMAPLPMSWAEQRLLFVMVSYADFNLLKFPDRDQAMSKIRDLTCLSGFTSPRGGRRGDLVGRGPQGLCGIRRRSAKEIRHRSAR
jgi:hypothetical protein